MTLSLEVFSENDYLLKLNMFENVASKSMVPQLLVVTDPSEEIFSPVEPYLNYVLNSTYKWASTSSKYNPVKIFKVWISAFSLIHEYEDIFYLEIKCFETTGDHTLGRGPQFDDHDHC